MAYTRKSTASAKTNAKGKFVEERAIPRPTGQSNSKIKPIRGYPVKWDETPEQRNLRYEVFRIMSSLKTYYESNIWTKWIDAYKNYLLNKVDRSIQILDFQTNIKVPVVKMYTDALWKAIYDNDFNIHVTGRNEDDNRCADDMKDFLDWGFSVSHSRTPFMASLKEAMITGNGYGKILFVNKNERLEFYKGTKKIVKDRIIQNPSIKYVPCFNVFIDPTVESIKNSRYVIERKIMHVDDIVTDYSYVCKDIREQVKMAQVAPYRFYSYDFSRVKYLAFYNKLPINTIITQSGNLNSASTGDEYDVWYRNYLTLNYEHGYSEVIEYREDNKFILLVDGKLLYDGGNPLPLKRKPYFDLYYNKIPGIPFGLGMGISLNDMQEVADTILNLTIDNMKLQVAPMFQKIKGGDIFSEGEDSLTYSPFKVWEVNQPGAIQRLDLGTPDFSGIKLTEFLFQVSEMSEGVNSYQMGYQNKVERSATGVSALIQASKSSLLPLVESMNIALGDIAEFWAVIGVSIMDDEIKIKVKDDKSGYERFRKITMENLLGKFDIEFDAQALKTATRETRRSQLMQFIQLAGTSGKDPITGSYFVDMKQLFKQLLDSFEIPYEDIVLSDSQISKKQFGAAVNQDKTSKKINKYTSAVGGIIPVEGMSKAVEQGINAEGAPVEGTIELPPQSQVLRESMQL